MEGWWRAGLASPLGVTLCSPQSSASMLSVDGDVQEGKDDVSALFPRGHCLLGQ